jgi:hypothetical protein
LRCKLVVVEDADGDIEVKPQVRVLLSDAFERRDVATEIPGKKLASGWLARQRILDGDKKLLRQFLEDPNDAYCIFGTEMNDW